MDLGEGGGGRDGEGRGQEGREGGKGEKRKVDEIEGGRKERKRGRDEKKLEEESEIQSKKDVAVPH